MNLFSRRDGLDSQALMTTNLCHLAIAVPIAAMLETAGIAE
jgi:hypothetical protein